MTENERLAARTAWKANPATKGKPLPTYLQTDHQRKMAAEKAARKG
jgi:hypothetical protein